MSTAVALLGLLCAGATLLLLGAFLLVLSRASSRSRRAAAPLPGARGARASAKRNSTDPVTDYTAPFGFAALQTTMMTDATAGSESGGAQTDPGSGFADSTGDGGMDTSGPSFDGGGFDGGGGGFDGGGGFSDGGGATGSW